MKKKLTPQQKARATRSRNTLARCIGGLVEHHIRTGTPLPSGILERLK